MTLTGLNDYLKEEYDQSIFDTAHLSRTVYTLHLHQQRIISARIKEVQQYDLTLSIENGESEIVSKLDVKYILKKDDTEAVNKMVAIDPKVRKERFTAIRPPAQRHHIKNKTLYPLMMDRTVLFFTLLEGEMIRGIVAGFSKYDIAVHLKGGIPVTLLRHAIYDVTDKKGRCYLKRIQQRARDWKKSDYYVSH